EPGRYRGVRINGPVAAGLRPAAPRDIIAPMVSRAYRRVLPSGLVIASARPEHAEALEELQRIVFPTLADEERFKAAHYRKHLDLFPEGQFVGLDGGRVVAATATIPLHFNFGHPAQPLPDRRQGCWLTFA